MANLTRENLPTEIITDDSENFKLGNLAGLFANTSTKASKHTKRLLDMQEINIHHILIHSIQIIPYPPKCPTG